MIDSGTDEYPLPPPAGTPADGSPLRFIEGELRRPQISLLYRLSLLVVSLAMILLPLIYFAVIGFYCYGLYLYASEGSVNLLNWPFQGTPGSVLKLLVYLAPLLIGLAFVFVLVKPLFAPKPETHPSFSLNHADSPQLFALVGWICRSLNAPIPSRVDVDLSVNAGVRFRGGARSLFGNDMVLELGLPLVAGLNLGQFAGVIAHEYGHFSQGAAMRAGYLIRLINGWFYRVVYVRDRWDEALTAASEQEDQALLVLFALYLARLGIWCGRRLLWVLMWIGHALSSFLSRQMEFDADIYEIRMCGSETFASTQRRLHQLDLGAAKAQKQLIQKWKQERKLFDQIPLLIVRQAAEIPAEVQARHHSAHDTYQTRLFDFHPSDAERIRRALAAKEPGIFHATMPASGLFANFPELARRVTVAHYRDMVGPSFTENMLIPTEPSARRADDDPSIDDENIERYFLGVPTSLRPIFIAENKTMAVRHPEDLQAAIQSNRAAMNRLLPGAQAAYARLHEADARYLRTWQAAHLLRAGFQFDPADFNLTGSDIEPAQSEAAQAVRAANADLFPFEEAGRMRLADSIQLLRLSAVAAVIPDAPRWLEEARELAWLLSRLEPVFEPLLELRKDCAALDALLQYRRCQSSADNLATALEDLCAEIQERINYIQQRTEQIRYPFEHPAGQIFVSQYLRNTEYHADPFELTLREGNCHVEKSIALHQRLLGRLVIFCGEVERHALS